MEKKITKKDYYETLKEIVANTKTEGASELINFINKQINQQLFSTFLNNLSIEGALFAILLLSLHSIILQNNKIHEDN